MRLVLPRLVLLLLATTGCVAPGADVHLPPFYSRHARAGGGTESEALFGAVRLRRRAPGAPIGEWALRPLVSHVAGPGRGDSLTRFLVPLGQHVSRPQMTASKLIPLYWYRRHTNPDGTSSWRFLSLPLVLGRTIDGRRSLGVFLFGGVIHQFLSWDKVVYFLFPLFARTTRSGRNSWHFLWPLVNKGEGLDGGTFRILPFYAESIYRGHHERRSVLWPIFHFGRDELDRPDGVARTRWMIWPLFGVTRQGTYRAYTILWPFFGWARDRRTGFWAYDAPWPFVRVHSGGNNPPSEERKRFWPFYSYYRGADLESTWVLWPFYNRRRATYKSGRTRDAWYLVPFVQDSVHTEADGTVVKHWFKVWPLFQDHFERGRRRQSFPALNPLWPTPVFDDHYAWIYELYTVESRGPWKSERIWGNLYRRELDEGEDREYWLGLWSRRRYADRRGPVRENALLFGLLRWRSRPTDRFDLLRPAFPGPGWPARRAPAVPLAPAELTSFPRR